MIDKRLTFEDHARYIKGKMSRGIGIIIKASKLLTQESLITLYYSFIYPFINYCISVWGNTNQTYLKCVEMAQKRSVRIICKVKNRAESSPLFKDLKFLTLKQLYVYSVQMFMYKYHHSLLPIIFDDFFIYNCNIHDHYTRQMHYLHVPKRTSNHRAKQIKVMGVQINNLFEGHVNHICSLPVYKKND